MRPLLFQSIWFKVDCLKNVSAWPLRLVARGAKCYWPESVAILALTPRQTASTGGRGSTLRQARGAPKRLRGSRRSLTFHSGGKVTVYLGQPFCVRRIAQST
ncbi:hypothetical protein AAFF_G00259850 [Aldrovandia affinis]|uniref:Uncharacterized protein n=1 Tax=Aldrovandia affinis TaxID=143900 RepID=A0AAD7RES0_9TELE|nr:hypothetical protein AAFF_G00259850 [Aldrovandia affinis]